MHGHASDRKGGRASFFLTRLRLALAAASVVAALAGVGSVRAAPVPPFEVERLTFSPGAEGSLVAGAGALLPPGGLRVGVAIAYVKDPLVLEANGQPAGAVLSRRFTFTLMGAFAPLPRLEISAQLPVVIDQAGDDLESLKLDKPSARALGTPIIEIRGAILGERYDQPFDLALGIGVGLPLGSKEALTREDGVILLPRLGAGKRFASEMRAGLEVGAWIRPKVDLGASISQASGELGSQIEVTALWGTCGTGARGELVLRTLVSLSHQPLTAEVLGALRVPVAGLEVFAAAGPGYGNAPGTPSLRALLGAALRLGNEPAPRPVPPPPPPPPPAPDRCRAGAPHVPAECPDLDADRDGVKNRVDRCPLDPEDRDGFEDGDGCPELDNDRDGVADASDKCPMVPGPAVTQGCPAPPDNDRDGVPDSTDACPTEPGRADHNGCPAPDRDRDGVEDALDACIDEPGPPENAGCPAKQKQLVEIHHDRLVLLGKIYFQTNKAIIRPKSFPLLNQIAKVLGEHAEIKHVVVEGHADNSGRLKFNRTLSQKRAESVRAYLVKKGVLPARISAHGYGADRPVDTNDTAAGRERNRRVEFVFRSEEAQP